MNQDGFSKGTELPAFLKVAMNYGIKKPAVTYPKIDLELLVRTTLALQSSVNPSLSPSQAREEYKKLAHEAVLVIEGCQLILSNREAMQAALDKEAARKERESLPRTVAFRDGIHQIVGDSNEGQNRGLKKLKDFLGAFYGEFVFEEPSVPECAQWVEERVEFWRRNKFNKEEVQYLRYSRNSYIGRGILKGDLVSPKIIEENAFLRPSDPTHQISDQKPQKPDPRPKKAKRRKLQRKS